MRYKEPKPFTCRLDNDEWLYVYNKGFGHTFNESLRYFIRYVRDMEGEGLAELRGYFTPNEWKYMADALDNCSQPIWSRNELSRKVMEIRNLEAKRSYYNIDLSELCEKISSLSPIHVMVVSQRIHEFWDRSQAVTMDEWSKY